MTLFKAVEAAREALELSAIDLWIAHLPDNVEVKEAIQVKNIIEKALAALPAEPMTKSQALGIVKAVWKEMALEAIKRGTILTADEEAYICIEALNKANCLYVKED